MESLVTMVTSYTPLLTLRAAKDCTDWKSVLHQNTKGSRDRFLASPQSLRVTGLPKKRRAPKSKFWFGIERHTLWFVFPGGVLRGVDSC
jgi:hypothetical protein